MAAQPIAQAGPALSAWGLAASLMLLGGLIQSVEWVLGTLPWAQGSPSVLPSMLLPDCLSERAVAWAAREGWERRNTLPWRLLFIEPSTPSPSSFLPPSRIDTLPSWAKAILGRSSFLLLASKNKVPLGLCPGSSGNEFQSVLKDQLWVNGIWLEPGGDPITTTLALPLFRKPMGLTGWEGSVIYSPSPLFEMWLRWET